MTAYSRLQLLSDFSMDMTGKDVEQLQMAAPSIPVGTRINVTFLGNEDIGMRLAASKAVLDLGFVPVPHISARRLKSEEMLEEFLLALSQQKTSEHLFSVGGDPHASEGPYENALDVINSGLLQRYGATDIAIAGYPEGHPDITNDELWRALDDKHTALVKAGISGSIITQFGFDEGPIIEWIETVRSIGIDCEIRIGVPGPAGIKRLLAFGARFGVGSSASIARKYGFSLTSLMGTAGPNKFIARLAKKLDTDKHGDVKLHFYTFGGLATTTDWIREYKKSI